MIAPGPSVLTVILNWRTPEMTLDAANAALAAMEGIAGAVTIVDNDSGDGSFERMTAEVARRGWGRVRVLQSGRNGGFGAGNNFGIRAGLPDGTAPDYFYVLNSDAFPAPGAIRALLDRIEADPGIGIAGSYIHGPEGDVHPTAFRFPSVLSEFEGAVRFGPVSRLLARHVVPMPVPERTVTVDWLAGASMLLRRAMLDQVGGFDEAFFLYYEETELCRRAARAGWRTVYVRESDVAHIGSVSTGMKTWGRIPGFWLDSRLYYFTRVHGAGAALAATALRLAGGGIWRLRCLLERRDPVDPPHFLRDLFQHYLTHAGATWRAARSKPWPGPPVAALPADGGR